MHEAHQYPAGEQLKADNKGDKEKYAPSRAQQAVLVEKDPANAALRWWLCAYYRLIRILLQAASKNVFAILRLRTLPVTNTK
jgi:hypothetical protein